MGVYESNDTGFSNLSVLTSWGREMAEDLFSDDDLTNETLDDAETGETDLRNAVLYHTDWTVETIVGQIKKGRVNLNPEFQRRDAWTVRAKSLLIESILLNFPVPPITLAERASDGRFIVVDGKQRLTAIAQFLGELPDAKSNSFKLVGLSQLRRLNGVDFKALEQSFPREVSVLENYPIRTNIIRGWKNDSILFSIFHRLNSGSVKLSPQELRQSLFPGDFTNFIGNYCNHSPALKAIFPGSEPDFRMRDIELAIRYISLVFFIEEYQGNLKNHLDVTVSLLNRDWGVYQARVLECLEWMEETYFAYVSAFGSEAVFRKWNRTDWESRSNRAVFDAVMFAGLSKNVVIAYRKQPELVVEAFKEASEDEAFRDAVERTTKTTKALYIRITTFCDALSKRGIKAPRLEYENDRISVLYI